MANLIEINEKYALGSDDNQWKLMKKTSVKNKETGEKESAWVAFAYFSTIEASIKHMWGLLLRSGNCTSMAELVALSRSTEEMLKSKFTHIEV